MASIKNICLTIFLVLLSPNKLFSEPAFDNFKQWQHVAIVKFNKDQVVSDIYFVKGSRPLLNKMLIQDRESFRLKLKMQNIKEEQLVIFLVNDPKINEKNILISIKSTIWVRNKKFIILKGLNIDISKWLEKAKIEEMQKSQKSIIKINN